MKSVLLVQPNYQGRQASENKIDNIVGVHPPLGLLYLGAVLRNNNIPVTVFDANCKRATAEEVFSIARNHGIVGVSVLNQGHDFAITLAKKLGRYALTVCGGPHANGYADQMLASGFDIVVHGEGESAFTDICRGISLENIPGISWLQNGHLVTNPKGPHLDVNRLPEPAREFLPYGGTRWPYASAGTMVFPWAPILTSRGCPYQCYYCNKTIHGSTFRPRTPEAVVSEMVNLEQRYHVKEFDILDDVFNLDIQRAIRICDLIIDAGLQISIRFGNGIRADKVTPELAAKLKQAGASYVAFGLESGSQRVLDAIPKKITLDQIRYGVKCIQDAGISTTGLFMLGLLEDTAESMQKTISFAKSLDLDIAYFSIATPYPGTRFYDRVKAKGRLLVQNWQDFNHSYGKVLYEYPGAPSPKLVQSMFNRAYRQFYIRPTYLCRQVVKQRTANEWKVFFRGSKDLLRNLFMRGNSA